MIVSIVHSAACIVYTTIFSLQREECGTFGWLRCREESKLACGGLDSPVDDTPVGSTAAPTPTNCRSGEANVAAEDPLPFHVNSNVNKRLYLFEGDICSLRTDCLMCFTTDGFSGSDELAARLLSRKQQSYFLWTVAGMRILFSPLSKLRHNKRRR